MDLPSDLSKLIQQHLAAVRQDPEHNLTPTSRLSLYEAFGKQNTHRDTDFRSQLYLEQLGKFHRLFLTKADIVLGWLAILSARKILPYWELSNPTNTDPQEMLSVAEGVIVGKVDALEAYQMLCREFYDATTNLDFSHNEKLQFSAYATYAALQVTLCGFTKDKWQPLDDNIIKPSSKDFAALALKVFSCQDDNPPKFDFAYKDSLLPLTYNAQKRLEFWEWWLTEAIPQAWELAHRNMPTEIQS